MIRAIVFSLIAAIFAAGLAASLREKPLEPILIDAQSPGAWPKDAKAPGDAPVNMLLAPCPLTPMNLPILNPDRKA